eukprot:524463-Prorocentrum_minimum.AAC.3
MALGLSHSLSRYKLKFSPDKVRLPPPPVILFRSRVEARFVRCYGKEKGSTRGGARVAFSPDVGYIIDFFIFLFKVGQYGE